MTYEERQKQKMRRSVRLAKRSSDRHAPVRGHSAGSSRRKHES